MGRFADLDIDVHYDLKDLAYEGIIPVFSYFAMPSPATGFESVFLA